MALRSHNILTLLSQTGKELKAGKKLEESQSFQQLIGTETPWSDIFRHIDAISDFALRHSLRALEFDYTIAYVHAQMQHVLPRSANDVYALEKTSYLTGLVSNAFNLWDEYCAALDLLESDLREALEERNLTPRRVKGRLSDLELVREILGALNQTLFVKTGLTVEEGAINRVESHSAQLVLCERVPGIPLSLSILYLIAGTRLGFPLYGVNTPGRFLLKWLYNDLEIFIDVFDKGTLITRENLEMLVAANLSNYSPRLFDAAPFEIIARRSLANLTALAVRDEDEVRARKLEQLSRTLFGF